ncbi:MAG: serine/threonine-protein kinase, partial [Myxococcaceae bacterium]
DYGLALLRTRRPFPLPSSTVLVEPEYLAPERISGNRSTQRSDIYALGVLLYEALTGFPPFTSVDPSETRRKHLHDAAPPLPPSASRLASIIHKCLAKDPAHRYGSAESVRMALSGLVEGTLPLPGHSGGKVSFTLVSEGDELGSYKLEKLLGEGAMGQVYLARHSKLGRQVALKILKPQLASDRNQVQRFFQEARAVNQVSHPHIVQISDFMDEHAADGSRHVYCVMEFLEGKTLRERLEAGHVSLEDSLRICSQVANALHAAHQVGVVHRDLKPDNLFLTQRDGRLYAKVLDFGIAKLQSNDVEPLVSSAANVPVFKTQVGVVVGTPAYMAPEQAMGEKIDGRADMYALGVVLYRMLSGKLPFSTTDFEKLVRDIVHTPPPPLPDQSAFGEAIPQELRELVEMCLEKAPAERFASMAELAAEIDLIRAKLELKRTGSSPVYPLTRKKRSRKLGRRVVIGAAALLALGGGLVLLRVPSKAPITVQPSVAPVIPESPVRRADSLDEMAAVNSALQIAPPAPLPVKPVMLVVNSDPQGAVVFNQKTGEVLGVTPLRVNLPRSSELLQLHLVGDRGRSADVKVDLRSDVTANVKLRKR